VEPMHEIGLTDYYFKELLENNKDYLLVLVNGICGLNLKEEDIEITNTEERDSITYKTINYDIKLVCKNMRIDFEAQKEIVDSTKNQYGEYEYDINRAIYYASALHSSSYGYKEKGYDNRKSVVVFLYNYDIPGTNYIQLLKFYNKELMAEYDNIMIFRVSLVKIPENGKMELDRALKLLIQPNVETYFNDKSDTIRRAAIMLNEYDKSEKAAMLREARRKAELDRISELEVAERKGRNKEQIEVIKTMHSNGFDADFISKALSLDLEYVKHVLENN
jgi:predicted transposase/invertase (TIGR01784 family)